MNFRRYLNDDGDNLIDLAPLIDVVFILLIFFMVSTTFSRESKLDINLPEATSEAEQQAKPDVIVFSIDARSRFSINSKVLLNTQEATIKQALSEAMQGIKNPSVLINADADAPHRSVVKAMDAIQRQGISQIGLATDVSNNQ